MIPVQDGKILAVQQVRCGFCNHLNYYNETSVGLICEECDREIPIATVDGQLAPKSFHMFTRHDDDKYYDLVLLEAGKKTEEVISCLQHMLALNRNQVKQMLDELPVTLLTGINKMKADMLNAQLSAHDAVGQVAESKEQG
ncbi:MAG: ribosomal protein L7/L12 [Armatimonadetes bacterium]|nr:ribosomal protein L7/L12 [Armatimonadota bacterium]